MTGALRRGRTAGLRVGPATCAKAPPKPALGFGQTEVPVGEVKPEGALICARPE